MRRVLLGLGAFLVLFAVFAAGQFTESHHPTRWTVAELSKHYDYSGVSALLAQQAADWNRGDLDAFATGYKDSPDILFMGSRKNYGYDGMLAGYKRAYASREAMGMLTFADLQVQPLDPDFATATGRYHLERAAAGGGNADGYFLLVLERTTSGWKIVRDDTTSLPAAANH